MIRKGVVSEINQCCFKNSFGDEKKIWCCFIEKGIGARDIFKIKRKVLIIKFCCVLLQ